MSRPARRATSFEDAVAAADHLSLKRGLHAIKASEGRGLIVARRQESLLGSVAIDDDCRSAFPNDSRLVGPVARLAL